MAEDGGNLSGALDPGAPQDRYSLPRTYIRLNDLSGRGPRAGHSEELEVEPAPPACDEEDEGSTHGGESLPYPTLAPVVFFYLKQSTRPRSWCLKMVRNPYPFYQCGRVFHSPGQDPQVLLEDSDQVLLTLNWRSGIVSVDEPSPAVQLEACPSAIGVLTSEEGRFLP
ncbi:Voltage-dependent T-type calcium channel subunit alpha-1G [Oryzias melastigma]|uniref:Voltage-dependent T-type calcium channel subunit alpha-1G n=1 Tax=Oryzias melastigma TaxID=30732 RepID=A0A834KVH5_ORYME|nr:Voltage-dependent T-type calcium channel subunit alpha-1G [Oryzias melastigma]